MTWLIAAGFLRDDQMMKRRVRNWFSAESNVDYWDGIYGQPGYSEDCFRRRLALALSWLDNLRSSPGKIVLDAGCGAGQLAQEAGQRGYQVVGMDLSYQMLERAKGRSISDENNRPSFVQAEVDSLPLSDSSFDAAVCLGVVGYLASVETALAELARVIRPGGFLVISIYNKARLVHYLDVPFRLGNLARRMFERAVQGPKGDADCVDPRRKLRTFYLRDFRKLLVRAGFSIQSYEIIPVELVTLFGQDILPRRIAEKITGVVEQSSNIPFFESFGTMCVFRADRNAG